MDIRILLVATVSTALAFPQPPHFMGEGGAGEDEMDMRCPMMDCSFLEFMLPCERMDRYTPRVMIYGMECEGCQECRDYAYYRSLLNGTIHDTQALFEKIIVMQNYLDENAKLLPHIADLPSNPEVIDAFSDLLRRNADTLREYMALDPTEVIESLRASAEKLQSVLSGSNGEDMADILYDFTQVHVDNNEENMDEVADGLSLTELTQLLFRQLHDLSENHNMVKKAIEEIEPSLLILLDLPETKFENLWMHDLTTLRVAFKLLEQSRSAIKNLLRMNMDSTASSLQMIIMDGYRLFLETWETPSSDFPSNGNTRHPNIPDREDQSNASNDGSGDADIAISSGDEWEIYDGLPTYQENNLFFQWISGRYIKRN